VTDTRIIFNGGSGNACGNNDYNLAGKASSGEYSNRLLQKILGHFGIWEKTPLLSPTETN